MTEILFVVEKAAEGGYTPQSGASIVTDGNDLAQLRETVCDAVQCHFQARERPTAIRLRTR